MARTDGADLMTGVTSTLVDCACNCGQQVDDASAIRDPEDFLCRPYLNAEHLRGAAEQYWSAP
jgi:hypothetical protein